MAELFNANGTENMEQLTSVGVSEEHTCVQITRDLFLWQGGLRDENAKPWIQLN